MHTAVRRSAAAVGVVALAVVLTVLLVDLAPPRYIDFGGGDEENYLANGVRQAERPDAGYRFAPPEWEDAHDELAEAFLDAEGRLFRLSDLPPDADDAGPPEVDAAVSRKKVTVDADGDLRIAHDNLYATTLAAARTIEHRRLPYVVNHLLLALAAIVFADLVRRITTSWPAGVVAGALLLVLPSMLETTVVTRTENPALLLGLAFAWAMVRSRAATAYPGLLLVLLFMTRHEYVVPLLLLLAWAALGRRPGGWVVVAATVTAAYGFAWGPSEPGDLFPAGRDILSVVPALPAWALVPGYALGLWAGGRLPLDRWAATRWLSPGGDTGPGVSATTHRVVWGGLIVLAIGAEGVRRTLDVGETLFVFKGERLSTLGSLVDSAGWALILIGLVGLLWQGHRLADHVPAVVVLVTAPHALVLLRLSSSSADLYGAARRFNAVLLPVLLIGVALVVAALLDRRTVRHRSLGVVGVVAVVLAVAVGLRAPHDRRPALEHPTLADVDRFHDGVEQLDPGAVVVLSNRFGSMKSVLPMRVHHGRWAYVAWDDESAVDALAGVLPEAERSVYVLSSLLDVAEEAGATPDGEVVTVQARYNEQPGATLELHRVTTSGPS